MIVERWKCQNSLISYYIKTMIFYYLKPFIVGKDCLDRWTRSEPNGTFEISTTVFRTDDWRGKSPGAQTQFHCKPFFVAWKKNESCFFFFPYTLSVSDLMISSWKIRKQHFPMCFFSFLFKVLFGIIFLFSMLPILHPVYCAGVQTHNLSVLSLESWT